LETPPISSPYGQVYLQGGSLGVASYHFDSATDPSGTYISYSNAPSSWKLEDGSAPPIKKPFTNAKYDENTRTFTGDIAWDESPFMGDTLWSYTMVFSETFAIIEAGMMVSDKGATTKFPDELVYWRQADTTTCVGNVFCQGIDAIGVASYHFSQGVDKAYISYENAPAEWLLDDGVRAPPKKAFEKPVYDESTRTFTGEIVWDEGWNRCFKWKYTMVFSSDFKIIEEGSCDKCGKEGEDMGSDLFGRREVLSYRIFDEARAAMIELIER